ncbi:ST14 transmembrane serine protease matriptase b [Danio rerio]|uniref:ST14 transmembrane serine protease matriptase b n=1 Tax=Danio rerio TaxID=7955 RepID=A0JMD7_DANRE|nr:ST14 transmembrane serine protease matriptase b [Danio rerio]AAI25838.1 Suppression of tumorigenicity 14 (colon carcinoma) b [Danio rerio]AAI65661.1 St14b protein [Danio rerio]|eukprot:NP_001071205.1 suppressor of tumorigenicity 14 protein [Danio rerio]
MTHVRQHGGPSANFTKMTSDMEPLKAVNKFPDNVTEIVQYVPASDTKKVQKRKVTIRGIVTLGLPTALAIIALITGLLVWHFHFRYNGKVRKMFSGHLTISSQTFSDAYENNNSTEYKELALKVSKQLKSIYGQVHVLSRYHVASSVQGFSEGNNNGIIAYYLSEFNVRESKVSALEEAIASMDDTENTRKSRRGFSRMTDSLIIDGITSGAVDARLADRNLKRSSKRSNHAHANQTDIIRSPGFPDNSYSPNLYTEWQIRADPEHRVRLEFDTLDLEKDCHNDFIKVYDSLAPSEKLVITEKCGYRLPNEKPPKTVYTVKSNQLTVKFNSDRSYVSEGFSAEFEAFEPTNPCPGRFECDNDLCISSDQHCDGYNDCGDMSDERGCMCNETQIQCKNGFCKPSFWGCDGVNDCGDNTDEENCGNCKTWEFRCRSGRCISAQKQCNGYNDCGDGSDESRCAKSIAVHCSDSTYKCKNKQCISKLNPMCDGETDCVDGSDEAECKCGKKPPKSTRIIGGKDSDEGEWPWQVSLHMKTQGHVCGASVISNSWLVTAAHCVQDNDQFRYSQADQWEVYLGLHNQGETSKSTQRSVLRIIPHPQYDHSSYDNDIALMELDNAVTLNQNIWPICLPDPTHYFPAGKSVWITGWGKLREGSDAVPSVLQKAEVRIINSTVCSKLMDDGITPHMICAGVLSGGVDACQGDSGGPMSSIEGNGRMFLAGVVGWGDGCGRRNRPGVYTRVTDYRSWIREITGI